MLGSSPGQALLMNEMLSTLPPDKKAGILAIMAVQSGAIQSVAKSVAGAAK